MSAYAQDNQVLPTSSKDDGAKDEKMNVGSLEVVDMSAPNSDLLHDTGASETMTSNVDQTVSSENKSDANAIDSSKTREFPNVLFDNVSSKKNLEETSRLSRESPEVLSENASERMVENEDAIAYPEHVQHASVFCPMLKFIEMDSIMAQGIFLSEKEISQIEERKHSIFYKFSNITFDEKESRKSKIKKISILLSMLRAS